MHEKRSSKASPRLLHVLKVQIGKENETKAACISPVSVLTSRFPKTPSGGPTTPECTYKRVVIPLPLICPLLPFHSSPTSPRSRREEQQGQRGGGGERPGLAHSVYHTIVSLYRATFTRSKKKRSMAPSYEMAASILLCAEDSSSALGFGDDEEAAGARTSGSPYCGGGGSELAVDFPMPSEECVARWMATEAEHMPRADYAERLRAGGVDLQVRTDAVDWIWKVHSYYSFGPVTACLAVNYLDRFLSLYHLPEGTAWMTRLLSVACLSLAAKMEETSVPQSLDLQVGDARYVFEALTIQRMELLVLSTLKWRMQAVTPFSYIDYFLHQLNGGGNAPSRRSVQQAAQLILCVSRGTCCLEFRPSEIAATVAAAVAGEDRAVVVDALCAVHVDKERALRCHEAVQAAMALGGATALPLATKSTAGHSSALSAPRSPTGVLDAGCLSSFSSASTAASSESSSVESSGGFDGSPVSSKRRKISR
uniref:Uncharacterized protein n=1 Tax=Avena sativa TaxID=4498 RepID=A0ACD5XST4_AVESA